MTGASRCPVPPLPPRRARPWLVLFAVAAFAWPAIASANQSDLAQPIVTSADFNRALAQLPPEVRVQLRSRRGKQARRALRRIFANENIRQKDVLGMLSTPLMAVYVNQAILDIDGLADVPGIERIVRRLGKETTEDRIAGPVFELRAARQLKPRLRELSADVNGHEVDAVLDDGTLVEIKLGRQRGPRRWPDADRQSHQSAGAAKRARRQDRLRAQ